MFLQLSAVCQYSVNLAPSRCCVSAIKAERGCSSCRQKKDLSASSCRFANVLNTCSWCWCHWSVESAVPAETFHRLVRGLSP